MDFLDDNEFLRWMAVCAKQNCRSIDLFNKVTTSHSRTKYREGNPKKARGYVVQYINKNLTENELQNYLKFISEASRERRLEKENFDKQKFVSKEAFKEIIDFIDNQKKNTVSAVEFENVNEVTSPIEEKQAIDIYNDGTLEKVEAFKKMIGGNMREESG